MGLGSGGEVLWRGASSKKLPVERGAAERPMSAEEGRRKSGRPLVLSSTVPVFKSATESAMAVFSLSSGYHCRLSMITTDLQFVDLTLLSCNSNWRFIKAFASGRRQLRDIL